MTSLEKKQTKQQLQRIYIQYQYIILSDQHILTKRMQREKEISPTQIRTTKLAALSRFNDHRAEITID